MSDAQVRRAYVLRLADYLGGRLEVDPAAILGRSRRRRVTDARMLIMYWLRQQAWEVTEIGAAVGRDHSTVSYAQALVPRMLRNDEELAEVYRGMPAIGVRMFTEPDLVEMYARLTKALAEAQHWATRIDAALARERMPLRAVR